MPGIQYTPTVGFVGVDSFTYRVTNSDGSVAEATVTVQVDSDSFEVVGDHLDLRVGEPFAYQLAANDELAGLGATYSATGMLPDGMTLSSDGVVSGRFDVESEGSVGVSVVLGSGQSGGSTLSWSARIAPQGDAWLSPAFASTPETDAERVSAGLGGLGSWNANHPISASDLKELGDDVG